MNRMRMVLLAAFSLVLVPCSLSLAQEDSTDAASTLKDRTQASAKAEKTPAGVPAFYATIIKELELQGQQREDFVAKVRQRQQAIAAWKSTHEEQQKRLQEKAAAARADGDTAAENQAKAELKALSEELAKLEESHNAQLAAALTPEQRGKWAAYTAYVGLMRTYAKIDLSPEQKAQIKEIAYQHALAFGQLPEGDKKAREALRRQIMQEIADKVLTGEQKTQAESKAKVKADKTED